MIRRGNVKEYRDKDGLWRWQVKASGRIIGASTQGYVRKVDCTTNIVRVQLALTHPIKWSKEHDSDGNLGADQSKPA